MDRESAEQQIYDRLCYPGPEPRVLRNKFDIRDKAELAFVESEAVTNRLRAPLPAVANPRSYEGLKETHKHIFQDVYEWAGQERDYPTGRYEVRFAAPVRIKP